MGFTLRPATINDAPRIRQIIYRLQLNPLSVNWRRFIVATDPAGNIIGCGQVKSHRDGSYELASIAVLPEWRDRGMARQIIEHLIAQYPGQLYLTCGSQLEPLYQKFGFQAIEFAAMPPYFKKISRVVAIFNRMTNQPNHLCVMRRN